MKKLIIPLFAGIFSLGCLAQNDSSTSLNLEKEKTYITKIEINQQIERIGMRGSINLEINNSYNINYKLIKREDENRVIEIKFDQLSSKFSIKTEKPDPDKEKLIDQLINESLYNNTVLVKMKKGENTIEFINYPDFKDQLADNISNIKSDLKNEVNKRCNIFLQESNLKSLIQTIFLYIPNKPIEKNDEWTKSNIITLGQMELASVNNYKLNEITENTYIIDCISNMESTPSNVPVNFKGAEKSFEAKGNSKSQLTIYQDNGLIKNSSTITHIDGNTKILKQDKEIHVTFTNDIETKISTQY